MEFVLCTLDDKCSECNRMNRIVDNFKGVWESANDNVVSQSTTYDVNPVRNPPEWNGAFDVMAVTMELPATMEILCSTDIWVCDTAASNHFSMSKDGAYN